jgi:hypothetical protein
VRAVLRHFAPAECAGDRYRAPISLRFGNCVLVGDLLH